MKTQNLIRQFAVMLLLVGLAFNLAAQNDLPIRGYVLSNNTLLPNWPVIIANLPGTATFSDTVYSDNQGFYNTVVPGGAASPNKQWLVSVYNQCNGTVVSDTVSNCNGYNANVNSDGMLVRTDTAFRSCVTDYLTPVRNNASWSVSAWTPATASLSYTVTNLNVTATDYFFTKQELCSSCFGGQTCYFTNIYNDSLVTFFAERLYDVSSGMLYISAFAGANIPLFIKLDSNGNVILAKQYNINCRNPGTLERAPNGDFIFTGTNASSFYVLRLDSLGNVLWAKDYNSGGRDWFPIAVRSIGDNYIIGNWRSSGGSSDDVAMMGIDNAGSILWNKTFNSSLDDEVFDMISDGNGGCVFTGRMISAGSSVETFIGSLDSGGNTAWLRKINGVNAEQAWSIIRTPDGGYALNGKSGTTANTINSMFLLKLDSLLNVSWQNQVNILWSDNGNMPLSVIQDNYGSYYITANGRLANGTTKAQVIKYDVNGNYLWSKTLDYISPNGASFSLVNTNSTSGDIIVIGSSSMHPAGTGAPCSPGFTLLNTCTSQTCNAAFTYTNSQNTYAFQSASFGNNLTYLWDFGDGATSTLQNPTHTYVPGVNYCESFDNCVIPSNFVREHAFNSLGNGNPGCLSEWEVVSGTPSVFRNSDLLGGGITAYDGTQYALTGVCDVTNYSESVALLMNFDSGTSYTVSLAMRTAGSSLPINVDFVLLESSLGTNPYYPNFPTTGCTNTNAIPSTALTVYSLPNYSASSWQLITFNISNLTKSYTRLWIRTSGNPATTTYLLFDSLCIASLPYTACLTISDTVSGCSDSTCANIPVTIPPIPGLVWPGDANSDGIANVWDVLAIGIGYGNNGPLRQNATTNWIGQSATDWQLQFLSGVNLKHADCDGNSLIDSSDVSVIALNYGLTHSKGGTPQRSSPSDLFLEFPSDTFYTGDTVTGGIYLGTVANPVTNVYGITFSLLYDQSIIDSGSMRVDFANSWIAPPATGVSLTKDLYFASKLDAGHSRIDHNNISGSGKIADVSFVIQDNIDGKDYLVFALDLQFGEVGAIDKDELSLNISSNGDTLYVKEEISSVGRIIPQADVQIFPNPALNQVQIIAGFAIEEYSLLDLAGKEIMKPASFIQTTKAVTLDLSKVEPGVYMIHLKNSHNYSVCRKIVVMK